jgi:hypothetical protein
MTKIAGSGSISQRHGSADPDSDPDPHQNVMDPQHWTLYITPLLTVSLLMLPDVSQASGQTTCFDLYITPLLIVSLLMLPVVPLAGGQTTVTVLVCT